MKRNDRKYQGNFLKRKNEANVIFNLNMLGRNKRLNTDTVPIFSFPKISATENSCLNSGNHGTNYLSGQTVRHSKTIKYLPIYLIHNECSVQTS